MKTEVNPKETSRAQAFELWMRSPVPMVTLMKTLDVSRLRKVSRRQGLRFNMLLCWCIGRAASRVDEMFLLPEVAPIGQYGPAWAEQQHCRLFRYDRLGINVIVNNKQGGITLCDIPYSDDLRQFNTDYLTITEEAARSGEGTTLDDCMIVGTSALPQTELDCIVNQYSGRYNNPFLAWGRYRKGWFKTTLPISLQFHHAQMDGAHACRFLEYLQEEINRT